jgi:predicted lipid-binding transport protein (Tim44 family)
VWSVSTGKRRTAGIVTGKDQKAEFDVFDIYTIIFLALAVFIFLRLRNVLGQRTGSERPPFDRAARNTVPGAPDSNVVPIPGKVYDSFETVIRDREKHEQKTETRFVSIDKAELVGAEMRDRTAQLTVRFVSQMISVTRDKAGVIVDGNPDKVADITDVWTFARDTTSRDPNWKLVGTGSAH